MAAGTPWPSSSAAAAVGNGTQENMCLPITEGPKDHGSDGIWQWRLERLDGNNGLKAWCSQQGYDWKLMESQVLFMKWEMQRFYPMLWADMVAGTKRLETLTANFMEQYERPALEFAFLDKRIEYARATLMMLGVTIPAPTVPAPAPQPVPPISTTNVTDDLVLAFNAYRIARAAYQEAQAKLIAAQAAADAAKKEFEADKAKMTDLFSKETQ